MPGPAATQEPVDIPEEKGLEVFQPNPDARWTKTEAKLTREVVQRLYHAFSRGTSVGLACKYAGISEVTFRRWMATGSRDDANDRETIYAALYNLMNRAEGEAAMRWLGIIDAAADAGTWTAAAWKLERRYPDQYGQRKVDVTVGAAESFLNALRDFGKLAPGDPADGDGA